jgi:hypothetical protein
MRSPRLVSSSLLVIVTAASCSDDGNLGQDTEAAGSTADAPSSSDPAGDDDGSTPTQSGGATQTGDDTTQGDTAPGDTTDATDDTASDTGTDTGEPAAGCGDRGTYTVTTATYFGGANGWEHARDVAIDGDGNIVMVGGTTANDFPTTPGAYDESWNTGGNQTGPAGQSDAFVAKFDPDGQLVWSTVLGGPNYDRAYAVEIDDAGDIYVGGRAGPGFPTTAGALQPTYAGGDTGFYGEQNGFAAKILADGSDVVWSSYVGVGALVRDLDVDDAGTLVLKLGNNPQSANATEPAWMSAALAGAYQPDPVDARDSLLVVLDTDGAAQWASWLGGSDVDTEEGSVRIDGAGRPVLLFNTHSGDLPTTPGVIGPSHHGGEDVYVAMLSPDGSDLVFGTYLGGSGDDVNETHGLGVTEDSVYVMMMTTSTDLDITAGAFQGAPAGSYDVAVTRLDTSGALVASTYFGGSAGEGADGFSVAPDGEVLFVGETTSTDLPVTPDAHQPALATGPDAYVARLSADLTTARYVTYLGGAPHDTGRGAVIGDDCTVVMVGAASGPGFPVVDPWQADFAGGGAEFGNGDNIMAKLTFDR